MKLGRISFGALWLGTLACTGGGGNDTPDGQAAGGASQTGTGGTLAAGGAGGTIAAGGTPGVTMDAPVVSMGDAGTLDGAMPLADAQVTVDAAPVDMPPWRGGTRLKAQVLRGKDNGPAVFRIAFDTELSSACSFQPATDGKQRCLPAQVVPYYADAGCSQLVLPLYDGCTVPSAVSRYTQDCQTQGLLVGAKVTPAKVYIGVPGTCNEVSTTPDQVFYSLTVAPPERFVAGEMSLDPRGGNLEMVYWHSTDGGLFPAAAHHVTRGYACKPGEGSASGRCVPSVAAAYVRNPLTFADAACTVSAAQYYVSTCNAPLVSAIVSQTPGTCETGPVMSYTEAVPGPAVPFRKAGNSCFAAPGTSSKIFTAGADLPLSSLPALSLAREGGGRLKINRHRTATNRAIDAQPGFYDSQAMRDCLPQQTPAGWRCMPIPSYGVSLYSDAVCTMPAFIVAKTLPAGTCEAPVPSILYRDIAGPNCGPVSVEMFAVRGLITPSKLYVNNQGTCEESGFDPALHNVYGTVPATDADALPLEERRE